MVYASLKRLASSMLGRQVEAYVYGQMGDPCKVLSRVSQRLPEKLWESEIVVRMLAAPVNPSDINIIQGIYPFKPSLPYVAGNEGVGEVVEVGSGVTGLSVCDKVIPRGFGFGTWRTYRVCDQTDVRRMIKDVPDISAATLAVNACTAYRLLHDFVALSPGDVVIQNGGNSAVGQAVVQLAAQRNISTVSVVRQRPDMEEVSRHLKDLGGTVVISDEELRAGRAGKPIPGVGGPIRLALNCVGGKVSADLCKALLRGGVMVTYGGMSKQPLLIPAASLIFDNISLAGFWLSDWNARYESRQEMNDMWATLSDLAIKGQLKPPRHTTVQFNELPHAVEQSMLPMTGLKQILVF